MSKICAAVLNDKGDLLPYTCQTYMDKVEENMAENPAWERLKEMGCRVVQTVLMTYDDFDQIEAKHKDALAIIEKAISGESEDPLGMLKAWLEDMKKQST